MREERWIFMETVKAYLHTPYRWAGDDFEGIDCSGLVVEGLKAAGLIAEHEDMTADELWRRYKKHETKETAVGCLAFWFTGSKATHVAVLIGPNHVITAHRGGHAIKTHEQAMLRNAFVTYRPLDHRKSQPRIVDIFR